VSQPQHSIFFAIKGERHDGHVFIKELYEKDVREFVVEKNSLSETLKTQLENLADAKIFVVENTIRALQHLAANHRQSFDIPVVGITGSNGKTIVKEWLGVLMAKDYNLVKSPRSYNSQIGVPLSVWEINEHHNFGIFEAGISKSGEMEFLEPVIRPTIGIFTNLGSAHDEGFRSRKQKATEKLRLFQRSKTLIYCKDFQDIDDEIRILLKAVNPTIELIGWSKKAGSKVFVNVTKQNTYCTLQIFWNSQIYNFKIPFADDASIENAIHCIFLMLHQSIDTTEIQSRLDMLKPIAMRLELKQGINDCYLIDDTYNNDYAGLSVALDFMTQQHTKRDKVLIISDVLQSGLEETDLYESISELIKGKQIDKLVGIGEVIFRNQKSFYPSAASDRKTTVASIVFYHSTEEFLEKFPVNQLQSSLILVKGARKFEFEKIINRLTLKVHGTVFEINLDALTNNLNFYRNKIGSGNDVRGNNRNLKTPTTIINLGPITDYANELVQGVGYSGYIANYLTPTSYRDITDIVNFYVLSRNLELSYQMAISIYQTITSFTTGTAVIQAFTNSPINHLFGDRNSNESSKVNADLAQLVSINSEFGVHPFSPSSYPTSGNLRIIILYDGLGVSVTGGSVIPTPKMKFITGIFFEASDRKRDAVTPKRLLWNQNAQLPFQPNDITNYSQPTQVVPLYQWELDFQDQANLLGGGFLNIPIPDQNTPVIFGSAKNDWKTTPIYSNDTFFSYGFQNLDRTNNTSRYFMANTNQQKYLNGFIYNVDSNGNFEILKGNITNTVNTVGAPYHFYFGLKKGKTAMDLFYIKYIDTDIVIE
jgi:UDP-N-acetylmuramoyl-tripeptide--D-alanyl-D-alanine ligase